MPARELADGVLILVGGTLMLTPGFVTDAVGILCLLPVTRPLGRRVLAGVINRRLVGVAFPDGTRTQSGAPGQHPHTGGTTQRQQRTQQRPGPVSPENEPENGPENRVVQGEVVDERPDEGGQPPY